MCRTAYLFYLCVMHALLLKRHSPLPLFAFRKHHALWKWNGFFSRTAVNLSPQMYIYAKIEHIFWVYKGKLITLSVKWILYILDNSFNLVRYGFEPWFSHVNNISSFFFLLSHENAMCAIKYSFIGLVTSVNKT